MKLLSIVLFFLGGILLVNLFILDSDESEKQENSKFKESKSNISSKSSTGNTNNSLTVKNIREARHSKSPAAFSISPSHDEEKELTADDMVIKKSEVSDEMINKISQEFEAILNRTPTDKEILKMLKLKKFRDIQDKELIEQSIEQKEKLMDIQQASNQGTTVNLREDINRDKRILQLLGKDELSEEESEELDLLQE